MKLISFSALVLSSLFACGAASAAKTLDDFNHGPTAYGSMGELATEPHLVAEFKDKKFVCRSEEAATPQESPAAAAAFRQLVDYAAIGDAKDNFWLDAGNRKKREDLLAAAVKAGSWKAAYLDSLWTLRYPASPDATTGANATLQKLIEQDVPIVTYTYASSLYGRDYKTMYRLLSTAVDRGSLQAMTLIGGTLVPQARAMHPLAKSLLECAVKQGYAPAYASLGKLAWMEGHRLDAYRLWAKGINLGCDACSEPLESLARVRAGYRPTDPMLNLMPELAAINAFYDSNFFYTLSGLRDFERPLPEKLTFHLNDKELLALLKAEQG
ncbi:hypothetical protein [Erwinia persicina]|uniref:hypothetical protein n=1 Tax=Erwinia persicina TaxID=55211 RepID=UPI00177B81E2|nr:hypothetical protein [Erwinia persicina]MBD8163892.1 hypothetical protein [Erwinia persicina]